MPYCYRDGIFCLTRSGGCLGRRDVFVLSLSYTLHGQRVLQIQAGRWSRSEVCLSLSPLHQSWNLTASSGPVQGAKPHFCFLYCPFLAGLSPCAASLPGCAHTNASASKGSRTFCMGVAWEDGTLAAWRGGPRTHTSQNYKTDRMK